LAFTNYKNRPAIQGILVVVILITISCSPARHLSEGQYLLSKNRIEASKKTISEPQLKSYVLQKPNKRLLGTRFYLFLYNLSNPEKEKWPHGWLRKIGEEPVVYDSAMTKASTRQLKQLLEIEGFYKAVVKDSVYYIKENAIVNYKIEFNDPYRLKSIRYNFEDTSLASVVLEDSTSSLLRLNMRFDKDELQSERVRIENLLKEKGYFSFSKEYIFYDALTDPDDNSVDLTMHVKEYSTGRPDPFSKIRLHPVYRIRNVFVYPNFTDADYEPDSRPDTNFFRNLYFLTTGKPNLKPNAIANRNYIIPGELYKLSDVNRTYRNITSLNIVRFTNISFSEVDSLPAFGSEKYLDSRIEVTQKKLQSFQAEIAGTNSSGDLGVRGNLLYSNFNLFRGAEVFNMRITGAIESLRNQTDGKYKSMKEIGAETNIVFPKFFAPLRLEGFVKKFAPKTTILVSFNYQSRPDFTRSIANSSFAYKWNGSTYITHSVVPLEFSYVNIYESLSSDSFLVSIRKTPLGYSFEDHVVNSARYTFELNNQEIGKSRNFVFTRINLESAAFLVNLVNHGFKKQDDTQVYDLLNVPYFQYLLGDVDFRYYNVIDRQNRVVYRLIAGMGYPYGNSVSLPYEKKYFSGGPNSMRAWNTRDLGPGSYNDPMENSDTLFNYPNRNGDIKLEANVEYRFKLVWKVEAALFLDAGNIWNYRKDESKPGSEFRWNRFHKEIAVGTGFGARLDFSFFLLRIDVGLRLRDPAREGDNKWVSPFRNVGLNNVKFAIGYPF
jgi:hypothetical protein